MAGVGVALVMLRQQRFATYIPFSLHSTKKYAKYEKYAKVNYVAARGRLRVHTSCEKYARPEKSVHGRDAKPRLRLYPVWGQFLQSRMRPRNVLLTRSLSPRLTLLPAELKAAQQVLHTFHPLRGAAVEVAVAMLR